MFLVVDPNVIFSAVLGRGNSWQVFVENIRRKRFKLIAPLFAIIEIGKHVAEIAQRTKLSFDEAEEALNFIVKHIQFVTEEDYADKNVEARKILGEHEKDVPYLALALKFNCNIFSGDKTLKEILSNRVKNPKEMLEEIKES